MIYIAVCDDNEEFGELLKRNIEIYIQERNEKKKISTQYKIILYDSAKTLEMDIDEGQYYDILLLDIEMPDSNGMDSAYRIRKKLPQMLLFFISQYEKYVWEAFRCGTFRFIPKSQMDELLKRGFMDALEKLEQEKERYLYYMRNAEKGMIPIGDILYIWHEGKNVVVETYRGQIRIRKTLKDIYQELPEKEFVWANRGVICNLSQIKKKTGKIILMKNDQEIEIANGKLKKVGQQIGEYWQKEMMESWK